MKKTWRILTGLLLLTASAAQAQFTYTTNADDTTITITGYTGSGGTVVIPTTTNGLPVTSIGVYAFEGTALTSVTIPGSVTNIEEDAFFWCDSLTNMTVAAQNPDYSSLNGVLFDKNRTTLIQYPCGLSGSYTIPSGVTDIGIDAFATCPELTNVAIPSGVTNIGIEAFSFCPELANVVIPSSVTNIASGAFFDSINLTAVFFKGNAPAAVGAFIYNEGLYFYPLRLTVYYLPVTTGWDDFSADTGLSTVLWNPLIQTSDGSFGIRNNQFGFNITATNDVPVEVEVSTNLANPVWSPLQTVTLTNGLVHFSEPLQTNVPNRFYRLDFP